MPASMECARVGVTVGEWSGVLREVFGEYRPPTGVAGRIGWRPRRRVWRHVHARVAAAAAELGRPLKFLVGKPGLDGHSNGAEQIAVRARDAGFEVVYSGIRLTAGADRRRGRRGGRRRRRVVGPVGIAPVGGPRRRGRAARPRDSSDVPVVVGGIIPEDDAVTLLATGVARVFTPKDFEITDVLGQIVDAILEKRGGSVS